MRRRECVASIIITTPLLHVITNQLIFFLLARWVCWVLCRATGCVCVCDWRRVWVCVVCVVAFGCVGPLDDGGYLTRLDSILAAGFF